MQPLRPPHYVFQYFENQHQVLRKTDGSLVSHHRIIIHNRVISILHSLSSIYSQTLISWEPKPTDNNDGG